MNIPVLVLEKRLRKRYATLVQQHLHSAHPLACGLRALPTLKSSYAAAQAAWRFFANPRTSLATLVQPLHEAGRQAVAESTAEYVLAVHDWSALHYYHHTAKTDQTQLSHAHDRGYELASTILVDAAHGNPLAPMEIRLRAEGVVYSTREPTPAPDAVRLDELRPTMQAVADLHLARPVVHIIDSEADSVAHLRDWHQDGRLFVVRVSDSRRWVRYRGESRHLSDVVADLDRRRAFRDSRSVTYHDQPARQWIAEAEIVLDRPAQRHRQRRVGKRKRRRGKIGRPKKGSRRRGASHRVRLPGAPLRLRLVVSDIRNEAGELLAQWLLLTNVPDTVSAATIALWYYWRWRIESFFKLLKSAGQEVEHWQQETAEAITKRLVVASMACVVVWQLARAEGPDAEAVRALLVKLSGRQRRRGVAWTLPALLAGLWVLLAVQGVLETMDVEEFRRLAELALPRTIYRGSG
jgi:hypothetical protein